MTVRCCLWLASLVVTRVAAAQDACGRASAQPLDPAKSRVSPAIQELRRRVFDANVNTLTFHSVDQIYSTRVVGRGGPVWQLPVRTTPLAISYSFGGKQYSFDDFLERTRTNAFLILRDGVVLAEIYRNNTGAGTRFMSWSMAKSITSMLVGLAVAEGKIRSINDRVVQYLPELASGGYREVTIRQVLEMRSGVDYEERYDFDKPGIAAANHENSLVLNLTRFADMACVVGTKHPPGAKFEYKTVDTAVLGWILERVLGTTVSAYLSTRIWEPLGAEADGYFMLDGVPGEGREFTGAGFNATLRDYGRLGQMMLQGGVANGQRILPADWVRQSTVPAHAEGADGGYAFQWWTAPASSGYYASGLQGQYIFIDPDSKTVIVKLSHFPPGDFSLYAESAAFFAAASAWRPQ